MSGSGASDVVAKIKARSIDLAKFSRDAGMDLVSGMDTRLKDLGNLDNLRYMYDKGKLTILQSLGAFALSRDEAYDRRRHALITTRRLVENVHKEYAAMVRVIGELGEHHSALCALLQQFRASCDLHIVKSAEEPCSEGDEEAELAQSSSPPLPPPHRSGSPGSSSTASGHRDPVARMVKQGSEDSSDSDFVSISNEQLDALQAITNDGPIVLFNQRMRAMFSELKQTVDENCLSISRTSVQQLDASHLKISDDVDRAQTAYDTKRREVIAAAHSVETARQEVQQAAGNAKQHPVKAASLAAKEAALSTGCGEQEALLKSYRAAVRGGMKDLHFSLEQVSMSTWSTYNIFFSQMGHFFSDATVETKSVAKTLAELKNAQNVAKVISEEKKKRLAMSSSKGAALAPPTVDLHKVSSASSSSSGPQRPSPPLSAGPGANHNAGGAARDLFDDFVTSRANSTSTPQQRESRAVDDGRPTNPQPQQQQPTSAAATASGQSVAPPDWDDIFGS